MSELGLILINGFFIILSGVIGFFISNHFYKQDLKRMRQENKFHQFYSKFLKIINYNYLIDSEIVFNELPTDEQRQILGHLIEFDYLATREIQDHIYALNRASIQVPELIQETWESLLTLIISEYASLCDALDFQTSLR